ncbi:MAG TPA: TlpA disulfide reductase family protein [Gammaproteobacteria bacterium]
MKSRHKLLIGILLFIAAVAGYNLAYILHPPQLLQPPTPVPPMLTVDMVGRYRPEFDLPDLNNQRHSVSEWDGRVLLINFWATWCAPCREEIPAFIRVYRRLHAKGFEILGIAIDQPEFVSEFAREFAIPYPMLHGREEAIAIGRLYGNHQGTLPYSVLVGPDGRITHIHRSGLLTEPELIRMVESLLAENESKIIKLP